MEASGGQRVMLVDDDGVCLAMLARGLRKRGFLVTTFSDPRAAMEQLSDERPDAVITDMRMPHMTGLEVVQDVRARLGDTAPPVLVVSADGEENLLQEAFRLGAADYLLKPVSDVELGVKLERALKGRKPDLGLSAIPEVLGGWKLHEALGRGGSACVFRAERESEPGVSYALKVVWPHLIANTESLLRFRREIDTLSTLDHPQLVRYLGSGREGECFYYVMEHIQGGTLRDRIRARGPGDAEQVLDLVEGLMAPLDYLHEQGVVHRDIKPGNIFYREGDLVLGDFGLAKQLSDRGITLNDEFIGTPLYLAPEVFRSSEFDRRVDFYSLGVCAFELLLGRAPLQEKDGMRLIGRIIGEGLPSPTELLPGLAPSVAELLSRLMARDPGNRPRDAVELADEVRRARAGIDV